MALFLLVYNQYPLCSRDSSDLSYYTTFAHSLPTYHVGHDVIRIRTVWLFEVVDGARARN